MRRILVERARRRKTTRHGGAWTRVQAEEADEAFMPPGTDLLALDEALTRLESHDPSLSQVVMLRFFSGLEIDEISKSLAISPATVKRRWFFARAWLHRELTEGKTS